MNLFEEIFNKAQQLNDRLVDWRRTIHRHPELGLQEVRTAHFVSDTLASFGIRCQSVARTGLVALIRGSGERTVALRADMDALPIQEENTAEYRSSVEGVMHACGHDGHVAMLIGAAVILNNLGIRLPGGVKLIFQPAEEQSFVREGGGREMIQNGVLDSPTVASIVGLHLDPELPPGTVGVKDGPLMATSTVLEITVRGRSAHGARPHEGVDAIYAASQIVLSLQALISRETNAVDAKVVTIGEISGGTSPNVIAGQVLLRGTMRAFSNETMEGLEALVIERCCKVAEAFGASADVTLLCAAGRASGIPTRVGFATVRNHLSTRQLLDFMGSDLFVYHGFVEFYLEGKWVKATPAFNARVCERHRVPPLDFNGRDDALFQAYNLENRRFMEYVEDLGTYDDIPVAAIVAGFERVYGKNRVARWICMFDEGGENSLRDFAREEVVKL
jgi:amidohydrolase